MDRARSIAEAAVPSAIVFLPVGCARFSVSRGSLGLRRSSGDGELRLPHGILRHMAQALERLPMPLGYFRLMLRCFGDTPERRAAILAGTGVTDEMLRDPSADITLFQQVRQIENVAALFGDGWALRAPELWSPTSHGPLGVAGVAAPDVATMIEVIARYGFVRAPFYSASLRRGAHWMQLDFELTAGLDERLW